MKNTLAILFVLFSATRASAEDIPPPHAIVVHVPPLATEPGKAIALEAMIDAPYTEKLVVHWRPVGDQAWHDATFERSSTGGWFASLPPSDERGVEYFIRGTDAAGHDVEHFASERAPHVVRVDPSLWDRLEDVDLTRVAGRRNEVALDVVGHDFGNRYGNRDRFLRSEIVYSYKLLRQIHDIGFGFGSITGYTPETEDPMSDDVLRAMRYGFGQVRLRAHPSVFVDARLGLGISQSAFQPNVRGSVTFGKPWRSCVQVGGEEIGGVGPSAWVRLQWDTAPPLLMGASVVRTDLPGALIDVAGLYIAYDVQYEIAQRFAVRGQISYGARDGASHVGGGLGTSVQF